MGLSLKEIIEKLPPEDNNDYRSLNRELFRSQNKTCVVVDDDPTGNQTVYDIPLLAEWQVQTIAEEFKKETPIIFLLTNSRSLSKEMSSKIFKEITENVLKASQLTNRDFVIISRSDSTLRGHFSEIEIINENLKNEESITFFIPVMFEGGRVTLKNTHYILDDNELSPVNETPFSKDHTFGYKHADLTKYIEEKTDGRIKASEVSVLSLEDIRQLSSEDISKKIQSILSNKFCIANALNYKDLNKIAHALLLAESSGKSIVYRTSSSFLPSYIGLKPKDLLVLKNLLNFGNRHGGLSIVGSYVPKSSAQLNHALQLFLKDSIIEIEVSRILESNAEDYLESISNNINNQISNGNNVIVFTSRELVTGNDSDSTINIASKVSNALVNLVKNLKVEPKYLLAKGGITSNDLAIKGLGMKRSLVIGQVELGIPVWQMGTETKFPDLPYIVFPGNVGNEQTLAKIIKKLN